MSRAQTLGVPVEYPSQMAYRRLIPTHLVGVVDLFLDRRKRRNPSDRPITQLSELLSRHEKAVFDGVTFRFCMERSGQAQHKLS